MKVIIAGSRLFTDYELLKQHMAEVIEDECLEIEEVVSGTAPGADRLGERWAAERNIPIRRFPANWEKYGKAAGPLRNGEMAAYGDFLVAFWHPLCRGTTNMISQMEHLKKPYRRFTIPTAEEEIV